MPSCTIRSPSQIAAQHCEHGYHASATVAGRNLTDPFVKQLERNSDLPIDQLRAIDRRRLTPGPLAHVDKGLMDLVAEALKEVLPK